MIPYSRPKLSDLYTLSQSKLLEKHTLHSGTYLYSPYMAVRPGYFAYQHQYKAFSLMWPADVQIYCDKKPVQLWARGVLLGFLGGECATRFFKS